MRLSLILLLHNPRSSCFTTRPNIQSVSPALRLASDDEPANHQPNGADGASSRKQRWRKLMKRCVDYPSFAYDAREKYELMRKGVNVGSSSSSADVVAAFKTPCDEPRTISIPDEEPTENMTLFERLAIAMTSPPVAPRSIFTGEFKRVDDSARKTRLLNERCYARKEPFGVANIATPPSLADLSPPKATPLDTFWISYPFRIMTFALAFLSLPLITSFLSNEIVTMVPEQLDEITSKFAPGISILYGTFVSLTLSILYNRQQSIQSTVTQESSLLTMMTRNLLSLFRDDRELSICAGQCAADQIRTLVRGSRGGELIMMMYSDPYDRMMELVELRENELISMGQLDLGGKGGLFALCRDTLKDMNKLRAIRLSDEALALPPTHFVILNVLTFLILLGFVSSILPTVDANGAPSLESSLLFGTLCAVYILFYNFINDLNNPFRGVYQLRRSSTASHLLEAKWLIANHPYLRGEVDFEEIAEKPYGEVITIRSPGLGELKFQKSAIYPDSDTSDEELDMTA